MPTDIPTNPDKIYADIGWAGLGNWLGTGTVAGQFRQYCSFRKARTFARRLGLKNGIEWRSFCKGDLPEKGLLPSDMPACPDNTYADSGWAGWGDWLGTGNVAKFLRKFRSFYDARAFARSLKIKTHAEWLRYCKGNMPEKGKKPSDIPVAPCRTYLDKGWTGIGDWLGTGTIANQKRTYLKFSTARSFIRRLGLKSQKEWLELCKGNLKRIGVLPSNIPKQPHRTYADKGWAGMGDWLGTGRTRRKSEPNSRK